MGGKKSKVEYAPTTSTTPYATAYTSKYGNSATLNPFLTQMNSKIENTIPSLIDTLLNPSLDNPTTKAKQNLFYRQFNEDSNKAFENNLINPLSKRNMLRSSAATNLFNSFADSQNEQIANFNDELIANNQTDTTNLINTLMNCYLTGSNLANQAISNALGQSNQINYLNLQNAQSNSNLFDNIMKGVGTAASVGGLFLWLKNLKT